MAEDFTFLGVNEFVAALKGWSVRAGLSARSAAAAGGHAIEAKTKQKLSGSGTVTTPSGRDTRGRFTAAVHATSPPGSPPGLVTGTLRRSVTVAGPVEKSPGTWESRTGPTAVYGRIQEKGGQTGRGGATTLPARPYLAPSVKELLDSGELFRIMRDAWAKAQG